MFHSKPPAAIDAVATLEGAATPDQLNNRTNQPSVRVLYVLAALAVVALLAIISYPWWRGTTAPQAAPVSNTEVRNSLPQLDLPAAASAPPVAALLAPLLPAPSSAPPAAASEPSLQQRVRQRRLQSNLPASTTASTPAPPGTFTPSSAESSAGAIPHPLQRQLQSLHWSANSATTLGNRHYLLTQGSVIDCVLATRLITSQPGLVTCLISRDVYSANGRVVLLDRGSKAIGHYQAALQPGQERIFVTWSRLETPQGVIINLDSPSAGPLGEGGMGGTIDQHFGARFSSALLLSLIDDVRSLIRPAAPMAPASPGAPGTPQLELAHTQQRGTELASQALNYTIAIPPTLYKNQGERISIIVARDLDFSGVYQLAAR